MGMITEFICASTASTTIDGSKLTSETWEFLKHNLYFSDDDEKYETIGIHEFGEKCSGKLYSYYTGRLLRAFDNIAEAASEPTILYFIYEEGFLIRIRLDPTTKKATHEICEDKKWIKKLTTKSKNKDKFVATQFMGNIKPKKYLKYATEIPWTNITVSEGMQNCPTM